MAIGILHPGAMGTSIGATLAGSGHEVVWASQGRSRATRDRADADGLRDVESLDALVGRSDTIISVCPPGAALEVARRVATLGFTGLYLDANAVAPKTARAIAATVGAGGAAVLDGGIIGPPVHHPGLTVLYLSGDRAHSDTVAARFADGPLETRHVGDEPGAASAVKMAFAAWTKGTGALLLAIRALAETEGVAEGLAHAWSTLTPELVDRLPHTARGTAPKAWRFVAEMHEIAATFDAAGLPSGFHEAAAEIYEALTDLRDRGDVEVDEVVQRLMGS
jgi:3-hydroxyisobutyrate dehydrogenase-like beta-hydroxyacid dehydrogenase